MKLSELTKTLLQKDMWKLEGVQYKKSRAGNDMVVFTFTPVHYPKIHLNHYQLTAKLPWFLSQVGVETEEELEQTIGRFYRVTEWSEKDGYYFIGKVKEEDPEVNPTEVPAAEDLPF